MTEIVPAILSNDVSDFRKKYAELLALRHHFQKLHVDFADGEFVNNQTVPPRDLNFLKDSSLYLIAHFMTMDPEKYFIDAKKSGFNEVLFHFEVFSNSDDIESAISRATKLDLKPGIVINPETPLYKLGNLIAKVSVIQLMGIHPGFQGRTFMSETTGKIRELRALSKAVKIAVDGGIKVGIARQCAQAGADILVAGSAILKAYDEETAVEALNEDIKIK